MYVFTILKIVLFLYRFAFLYNICNPEGAS